MAINPTSSIDIAGYFATTPDMDEAGKAWLSLTDEERSELLHQRRHNRVPDNSLPAKDPEKQ